LGWLRTGRANANQRLALSRSSCDAGRREACCAVKPCGGAGGRSRGDVSGHTMATPSSAATRWQLDCAYTPRTIKRVGSGPQTELGRCRSGSILQKSARGGQTGSARHGGGATLRCTGECLGCAPSGSRFARSAFVKQPIEGQRATTGPRRAKGAAAALTRGKRGGRATQRNASAPLRRATNQGAPRRSRTLIITLESSHVSPER